jgi:hypothetical protein
MEYCTTVTMNMQLCTEQCEQTESQTPKDDTSLKLLSYFITLYVSAMEKSFIDLVKFIDCILLLVLFLRQHLTVFPRLVSNPRA